LEGRARSPDYVMDEFMAAEREADRRENNCGVV